MSERKHEMKEWKDAGNGQAYIRCWCGVTATANREAIHSATESHQKTMRLLAPEPKEPSE